jgi:5'(3')-deoxyribonucleotidase
MPKKVLILDVDGVIYNWDKIARELILKEFNIQVPHSTYWQFIPDYIGPARWEWLWDEGVKQGLFRWGSPYDEEIQTVKKLNQYFDIILVTKTPETARRDRLWWLAQWDLSVKGLVMLDKEESKGIVHGDVMVDDNSEYVLEWKSLNPNGLGIVFNRTWNADFDHVPYGIQRISHLSDLLDTGENCDTITMEEGIVNANQTM